MTSLEEKIICYGFLDEDERRHIQQKVREHPELRPLLEEAEALTALFDDIRPVHAAEPEAPILNCYAAYAVLYEGGAEALPSYARRPFQRLLAHIEAHPDLRRRFNEAVDRAREVDASVDPQTQFTRLSGHTLPAPSSSPAPDHAPRTAAAPAAKRPRVYRLAYVAVAAAVALLATYGVLRVASQAAQPDLERLAAAQVHSADWDAALGPLRSDVPAGSASEHVRAARQALRDAYRAPLGLFPTFDEALLTEAATHLQTALPLAANDSLLQHEILFLLATEALARSEADAARTYLERTLTRPGPQTGEAHRLLDQLGAAQ